MATAKVNFRSKRERKAARKSLRKFGANVAAERAMEKEQRREFYARLRPVKLNRRRLAREIEDLAEELQFLRSAVYRHGSMYENTVPFNPLLVTTAGDYVEVARRATWALVAEAYQFARRPVYQIRTFGT